MQIFKNFLLACSLAIATSPLCLSAEDTDAQAAARAALQQKMRDLKGGSATVETPAAAPAPKKAEAQPVPATMSEPAATIPANPPATIAMPAGASPDLIEQARQATRARMSELQGRRRTAIPVGQEAPASDTISTTTTVTGSSAAAPAKPSKAELRAAREREAAEKRAAAEQAAAARRAAQAQAAKEKAAAAKPNQAGYMTAPNGTVKADAATDAKARAAAEKAAAKAAKKAKLAAVVEAPVMLAPLDAPASSLPTTKEQALQSLTEQYRTDKISAEEYHQQRAKILAEP